MSEVFKYMEIATEISQQIKSGVLKKGNKLPSIRNLCLQYEIGMNTAKRVYWELESLSLIESKPQSGFFVSNGIEIDLPLTEISSPSLIANDTEPSELITKVFANRGRTDLTLFSIGIPSGNLLPLSQLKKEVIAATRELQDGGTAYEPLQGNVKLRRMVALRSLSWGGNLHENDLITTSGGMNALSFCLMALGKAGDTIAMESPCYPGIFQLAISLGYKIIELPTHPITGIDVTVLQSVIPQINLCLLIPNFNTPLGSCMPDKNKKQVVELLAQHNIPLIEDDIYGDLYFGAHRPKCCKSFDTSGNVLWCSSVSKTLAPGYRVGWIAPGKHLDKLLKLKLVHQFSTTAIIQEAVGNFMKTGRYEKHLKGLRRTLQQNYQSYVQAIVEYFPEGTKISRPQGGLAIWVEFDPGIDTMKLYDLAIKKGISIAPGRMFTVQNQFENCMRLCMGLPWTENLRLQLQTLGSLAKRTVHLESTR